MNNFGDYNLDKFEIDKNQKERYPYQDLGDEMIKYFGEKHARTIWIKFNFHSKARIEHVFHYTREKGITNPNYMWKILSNTK